MIHNLGLQWRRQDLEMGAHGILCAHSILRIVVCQTVHNFVYLGKVNEPLLQHEKTLCCSACLFAELSSN